MIGLIRKSAFVLLLPVFTLVSFLGFTSNASANADKPKVSISERKENSIVLKVRQSDLDKKRVIIRVRVENAKTGEKSFRNFNVRLDHEGKKKLKIADLDSKTEFKFRVQIRDKGEKSFSEYSDVDMASTK